MKQRKIDQQHRLSQRYKNYSCEDCREQESIDRRRQIVYRRKDLNIMYDRKDCCTFVNCVENEGTNECFIFMCKDSIK